MKKSSFLLKSIMYSAFIGLLIMASCKKDNTSSSSSSSPSVTSTQTVANNSTEGEAVSNDVLGASEEVVFSNSNNNAIYNSSTKSGKNKWNKWRKYAWNCANITDSIEILNGITYHKLIIDFGADTAMCGPSGTKVTGQIINFYHGRLFTKGYKDSIIFNNFSAYNRTVNGWHTVNNIGNTGVNSGISWNIDASLSIKKPNGKSYTWIANRQRTLTIDTTNASSAFGELVYKIINQPGYSYAVTGKATNDSTYTISITTPLIKHVKCLWIESGDVSITYYGQTATIDFGTDGVCNNKAILTYKGKTYQIKI